MKVGDKLICKTDIYKDLFINNVYEVKRITENWLHISSESGCTIPFSIFDGELFWGKYFYTKEELRKIKLKTII